MPTADPGADVNVRIGSLLYFANPTAQAIDLMRQGVIGFIDTPLQGNIRPSGVVWCADNGCFNDARFDETRWWKWLETYAGDAASCLFATAPDVKSDAAATLERSMPWLPKIRALGFPAAFVAQDGQQDLKCAKRSPEGSGTASEAQG
jgi:hypothetical protein